MGSSSSKESNSRGKNIQLKLPSEYSSLAFFYRKKAVVTKEKIEMKPSNEDAAAGRVSNLQVHKCQQVRRRIVFFLSNVSFNQLIRIFWLQHYRVIQTPDGNQTVALKSTSREKDLDNRVKTKSDRFCMHT